MDPALQEAFSDVQSSVYRTALKLRSVQSLCQLDLIDVSLIQLILSSEESQRLKQVSLEVQQISGMLTLLFQRARSEKPGQVDPRAAEFTLSLLAAMYDRSGTGYIKTRSAAAALIALSGDTLLAKYRAFFQFYAVPDGNTALITPRALRSLLTDLNQIPAMVGESCTPSCVEIAIHSCFHGVLNLAIVEEKFLSWLRSEPAVLLWLPVCYRLAATERVSHQARCRVCKVFPITGLRYRCLKCLNFDLCQVCFFTGRLRKPHKRSHPVVEHCVQVSAKASAQHFLRTLRNNLLGERCRRKEAQRRRALEITEERPFPTHKKTFTPAEPSVSPLPVPENLSFPVDRPVLESPKFLPENTTGMQKSGNSSKAPEQGTKAQAMSSFEADVLKIQESIKSIHSDSRYIKKQFSKWKDKMQLLQNYQEDKSYKIEAKLQSLKASHENLQMKLQQIKQEIKTMLQPSEHPSGQCQNVMPRNPRVLLERRMQHGVNPAQIGPASRTCAEGKALNPPSSAKRMELGQRVPTAEDLTFSGAPLEGDRPSVGQHKNPKETQTNLHALTESSLCAIMRNAVPAHTAVQKPPEEKQVREELELQQLVRKLQDALALQAQPVHQSALQQEFFSRAEHVSRSFSDLISHITSPACKGWKLPFPSQLH
ncbi:dystrotelin [Heliangelus exortis]|uniref:dystrotelin n=1 Tax=Heliangelus exortis TaxID=472823 RepID=UPI003A921D8D